MYFIESGVKGSDLQSTIAQAHRFVYSNLGRGANCDFARGLIECYSFQWLLVVVVDGLNEIIQPFEYSKGIARDVCLGCGKLMRKSRCASDAQDSKLTLICLVFQQPVARPWRLDCGLPGSTALILPEV